MWIYIYIYIVEQYSYTNSVQNDVKARETSYIVI
jgi:hypothetical protein